MTTCLWRRCAMGLAVALVWQTVPMQDQEAEAAHGWEGKRRISYQQQKDLFYNYYVGPNPSGTAAQLYVSPRPVPPNVGHTWVTYQPFMPHEYLYQHNRSYYTYNPGAGWTRTNVRYRSAAGCFRCCGLSCFGLNNPRITPHIRALNDDLYNRIGRY